MDKRERQNAYRKELRSRFERLDIYVAPADMEALKAIAKAEGLRLGPYVGRLLAEIASKGRNASNSSP